MTLGECYASIYNNRFYRRKKRKYKEDSLPKVDKERQDELFEKIMKKRGLTKKEINELRGR